MAGDAGCGCGVGRPLCLVDGGCAACTALDRSHCVEGEVCDVARGSCVACVVRVDCKRSNASVCDPLEQACKGCAVDAECSHIAAKPVCRDGECVECTSEEASVCKLGASGASTACDNRAGLCTTYEIGKTAICGACVSDAQCRPGSRCVETTYQGAAPTPDIVGWHCQWEQGAAGGPGYCDSNVSPFIGLRKAGSIDAPTDLRDMCVLRASSCPAYASLSANCGRFTKGGVSVIVEHAGDPKIPTADRGAAALPYIVPDDTVCPGPGSKCATKDQASGAFRCTTQCGNDNHDCLAPFKCLAGPVSYCSVN
jgi:hypothetical protein